MPAVLKTLRRLIGLLEERGVPYMLIGGYALPFYGRIRTTLDVDLAIMAGTEEELERLREELPSKNFEVRLYSPRNPLFILADREEGIEVKVWLRPDGVVFDEEALRRRRRVKLGEGLEAWIVSPEDFIVNRLARPDRGCGRRARRKERARQAGRQAGPGLPQEKSRASRGAKGSGGHPGSLGTRGKKRRGKG